MFQAASPPRFLPLSHWRLLRQAPAKAWVAAGLLWLVLFGAFMGLFLSIAVDRQRQSFEEATRTMKTTIESRLKVCEMLVFGLSEIVGYHPTVREERIREYALEASRRYGFVYTLGYQPRITLEERPLFEAAQAGPDGEAFSIRDYLHDETHHWHNPLGWTRAGIRAVYLPWMMAEPPLPRAARAMHGLDLLHDTLTGPTVTRALKSSEIEVTPTFRLMNNQHGLGYVRAIYRGETAPSDPAIRSNDALGIVTLVVKLPGLLHPTEDKARQYDMAVTRYEGSPRREVRPNRYDQLVYESRAPVHRTTLERWLLPRLETRVLVDVPYFPYELAVSQQLGFSVLSPVGPWLAMGLSTLISYFALLVSALHARHRRLRQRATDNLYLERGNATVILQAISDAVITFDNDFIVQYLNPAAARLLGHPFPQRAVGQPVGKLVVIHYDLPRQAMADPFTECLQRRSEVGLAENSFLILDGGQKLHIEGTVSPLFDRGQQMVGAVLTFRDTAPVRRRMLEALEASERRLRQHEVELARVARINSMGEMASGIAHEINQPLSAIMSYCEASLSLLEEDEPDLEMIGRALRSAVSQADRAGQIIHRLREFVARKTQQFVPVDVNHVVGNALILTEHDLRAQGVEVIDRTRTGLPLVYADTIQLEQVVLNLIRNALDAMQGVYPYGRLQVETGFNGERVFIRVRDNGSGIPPEEVCRIFDPFFSTKATGMGLGLTISQTIIESVGGTLKVSNNPEGGAEFSVELPPLKTSTFVHTQEFTAS